METVLKDSSDRACLKEREGIHGRMAPNTKDSSLLVIAIERELSKLQMDSYTKDSSQMKDRKVCARFKCRREKTITDTSKRAERMAEEHYFFKILKKCLTGIGETTTSLSRSPTDLHHSLYLSFSLTTLNMNELFIIYIEG